MSCMSLKTFDSLKLNLTKERFPLVVTATGTSMDPIGFTQCTFFINGRSFTQKFIVCTNQTRPVILGKDFTARNCIGVIWTKQGSRRMVDDCNTTIMEVFEQTRDVPLSLANPIRIPPRSVVVALVECNRPLHAYMDIKGDAGFLREYPNIHVSRTYVNELPESSNCMPFSFTNIYQGLEKWTCRMLTSSQRQGQLLMNYVKDTQQYSPKITRILAGHSSLPWTSTQETALR